MHAVSSNYPNATAYDKANWGTGGNLGYYKATNSASDLTKIFDDIQKEITTGSAYSGVSIVDELSEYAQVDGVVWNMAGMRNFGGTTYYRVTGGVTLNVTNLPSGATPPVLERDYTLWYSDAGNGKIRVEFAGDYELLHNATYTLSYGIVPTDSAYARVNMVDGGINYDATGDAGTGTTSAGKPGFRSNASGAGLLHLRQAVRLRGLPASRIAGAVRQRGRDETLGRRNAGEWSHIAHRFHAGRRIEAGQRPFRR